MSVSFTDRELDVMAVLWDLGPATVTDVRDRLADPLAYTTVLTVLRTLEAKGYVGHVEEGRAHRYHPLVDRDAAGRSALRRLLGTVFGGSPELLLTNLVETRGADAAELARLRAILDERAGGAPADGEAP
jgi:BlaI family transcriptional regulator, penicillinase repressor